MKIALFEFPKTDNLFLRDYWLDWMSIYEEKLERK